MITDFVILAAIRAIFPVKNPNPKAPNAPRKVCIKGAQTVIVTNSDLTGQVFIFQSNNVTYDKRAKADH
jgi:hypothetical protein